MNLADIPTDSTFASVIADVVQRFNPKRILETGTHVGLGSTRVLAEASTPECRIVTIECDKENNRRAKENLKPFADRVDCRLGLSLPRSSLPTAEDIDKLIESTPQNMYVDRVNYLAETDRPDIADDLIGKVLRDEWGGKADLILLDSAGHVGFAEFLYALGLIKSICIFVLDDVRHVKHWKSAECIRKMAIRGDAVILGDGDERHGWMIAMCQPTHDRIIHQPSGYDK
jgi:hypothetical protein